MKCPFDDYDDDDDSCRLANLFYNVNADFCDNSNLFTLTNNIHLRRIFFLFIFFLLFPQAYFLEISLIFLTYLCDFWLTTKIFLNYLS